jgi:glycolate oxidase FAD binding subunit
MLPIQNAGQLAELIAASHARAERISSIDLRQMNRVIELAPEDMTVTVEAGLSLGALQRALAKHRQWLPIDPPNGETISIHEVLSKDLSGPRRFGCGTIREHLIGMKVVLADGRVIKSGGKVVKNVAGYDLAKLFIGARDSLGIIAEATFKLRPWPAVERFVGRQLAEIAEAKAVIRAVLDSDLTPVVLDAHRLAGKVDSLALRGESITGRSATSAAFIVLGFAGTRAEVEWQLGVARALGVETETDLDYETAFWSDSAPVNRLSVLPSRLTQTIDDLGPRPFIARAGNGVIYFRGEMIPLKSNPPRELPGQLKNAYDPKNILPDLIA